MVAIPKFNFQHFAVLPITGSRVGKGRRKLYALNFTISMIQYDYRY